MATGKKPRDNSSRAAFEKREKRRTIRALQDAIAKKDRTVVEEMLSVDFDVDFQYRGQTALQLAVREGCYDICQLLIGKGADVNKCDAELNNLLNMACWRGYSNIAQLLITHSADLDARNDYGSTSLNTSVYKGYEDICQKLVEANCDPDIPNHKGETPLHTAAKFNNKHILELLIKSNCCIDSGDEENRSALLTAVEIGYHEIVGSLLQADADSNMQDRHGRFALYEAALKGHTNIVKQLISIGKADLNICTKNGVTALLESIRQNHMEIATLLLEAGCDPNVQDRTKQAPIHAAVRQVSQYFGPETHNATDLVRKLIDAGCDVNVVDNQGWCPLYQSAFVGDVELTRLLLDNGACLDILTNTGESILHGGVSANQPLIVDVLIAAGCGVDSVNQHGEHPLYTAVKTRANIKIIESLIQAGSDLDLQEKQHLNAPIHEALVQHHTEAALLLLEAGCNVNIKNSKLQNPLYTACEKGSDQVLARLFEIPSCTLRAVHSSVVPLHAAISCGQAKIALILIEAGCDINQVLARLFEIPSCTLRAVHSSVVPLHAAISCGQAKIALILIEAGCDINQLNHDGLTPIQAATQEDNFVMAKLLLRYGCDLAAHTKITRLAACCLTCEDPHPHFELEPLFLAMKHRNVELMRLFLRCYYSIPHRIVKLLGNILQNTQEMHTHYPLSMRQEILSLFAKNLRTPRKLQDICRMVVLESIGTCPHFKVPLLPLASKVKDFVLRKDIFDPLDEEDKKDHGIFLSKN